MKKLAPVFVVERIEPCLDFWVNRLGFAKTVEVPHGDCLGFVILAEGNVEIMYQSRDSVEDDVPGYSKGASDASSSNGDIHRGLGYRRCGTASRGVGDRGSEEEDVLRDDRVRREGAGREFHHVRASRIGRTRVGMIE